MSDAVLVALVMGIPSLVVAISGFIIAVMTRRDAVRKDTITTLQAENSRLSDKLEKYQAKFDDMESEIQELRGWIATLQKQVRELGGVPASPPINRKGVT